MDTIKMHVTNRLYLVTLEATPLVVNGTYNPLPSHLTLVSRFESDSNLEELIRRIRSVSSQHIKVELLCESAEIIGPKHTPVFLIKNSEELQSLHNSLISTLKELVNFKYPEFILEGWKPHISRRTEEPLNVGMSITSDAIYLIEVVHDGNGDNRIVRSRQILK